MLGLVRENYSSWVSCVLFVIWTKALKEPMKAWLAEGGNAATARVNEAPGREERRRRPLKKGFEGQLLAFSPQN